jgi:hypothetical protein
MRRKDCQSSGKGKPMNILKLEQKSATVQTQESEHVAYIGPPKEDTKKATPKKPKLTEADQREALISILLPYCKLKGNMVIVSIPTGTHYLKPSRNQPDAVKEWAYDQFHQAHGKAPMLQAYKAACTSIGVTLLSQVMQELSAHEPSPEEDYGDYPSDSAGAFSTKERVDGHDNLYIFDGCKIGRLKTTKEGDEYPSILWDRNAFPTVHEVLDVEDASEGIQTQYDVTIAGKRHTLPLETFKSGNWYDFFPGITGVLDSSKEKLYKAVLMQVASKAPRVAAFLTTGLKEIKDAKEWVYVFPDGRFQARPGADLSTFKVRLVQEILSPEEKRVWKAFQFPTEMPSREKQQSAYNYIRDVAPRGFGLLNFSHMIGAMLYELRNANFGPAHVLVDEAPPGEGKTTLAGLFRCLVYPYQGQKPTPDSSFQDTVTSIEDDLTYRSSMPVIVDDFVMEGASETKKKEMAVSLDAFSRAVFNVKPVRKRMRSSRSGLRKQRANYIRTLPVATVEGLPEMPKSWYRRVLISKLSKDDVIKKSDGRADVVALDQMGKHAPVLQSWGHLGIIQFFLEKLEKENFDTVVRKIEGLYRQATKDIRDAVINKWAQDQHGTHLPSDWDSIGDSAACELLYFRLAMMTALKGLEVSDTDIFPHLVETVYQQLLRMEGKTPDAEGMFLFEKGVIQLFEEIRSGKIENSQRWRVDHKVTATGPLEPPQVWFAQGQAKFPAEFWGWTPEMIDITDSASDERYTPRVPQHSTVAYVDDTTIYVIDRARKELLKIIQRIPTGESIATEDDLWKQAEKEGWIVKRGKGDRRALQIVPPQGPTRVWALSLARYLAHYQDIPDEELARDEERPDNVSDFPGKTEPPPFDSDEEVSGDF